MTEDKKFTQSPHNLIMEERRSLTVTGVTDIERFDEEEVVVCTDLGELSIRGEGLHLNKIDVADGELLVEGEIDALSYSDKEPIRGGFLSKLFR